MTRQHGPVELTTDTLPDNILHWLEVAKSFPKKPPFQGKLGRATPSPQWSPRVLDFHQSESQQVSPREKSEDEWDGNEFQGHTFRDKLSEGQRYITEIERKIYKYQSQLRVELNQVERKMPKFRELLREGPPRNRLPWISSSRPSLKKRYTNKLMDLQSQLGLPRCPPQESLEPSSPSALASSWPSTPSKDSPDRELAIERLAKEGLNGSPGPGVCTMSSPRPQVHGQRYRQAQAMLAACDVCASPDRSKKDLEKAASFARDAHKIFSDLGDKRMQAAAHLAFMGVHLQDKKTPREPKLGDEVENLSTVSALASQEDCRAGDRGRVSSCFYIDQRDGIEKFDITWYSIGITSALKRDGWENDVLLLGNTIDSLRLGDEVEALPGTDLMEEGIDYYKAGDRGRMSDHAVDEDGMDRYEVMWYRTGLKTRIEKDVWLKNFRFISVGDRLPSIGDEIEALPTTSHSLADKDTYEPGDKARVIRESCDLKLHGGQIEVMWYRTRLTSTITRDSWMRNFRLVRSNAQLPRMAAETQSPSPSPVKELREKALMEHDSLQNLQRKRHPEGAKFPIADASAIRTLVTDTLANPHRFERSSSPLKRAAPLKDVDAPGRYRIVLDKLPVTREPSVIEIAKLPKGSLVEVLEHSTETVRGRMRARIREPAGWISLSDDTAVAEIIENHERYRILRDDLPVSSSLESKCSVIKQLNADTDVEVLEVLGANQDGRIQARIKHPDGWITLKTEDCRFAVPEVRHSTSVSQQQRSSKVSGGASVGSYERSSKASVDDRRKSPRSSDLELERQAAKERELQVALDWEQRQRDELDLAKRRIEEKQREKQVALDREQRQRDELDLAQKRIEENQKLAELLAQKEQEMRIKRKLEEEKKQALLREGEVREREREREARERQEMQRLESEKQRSKASATGSVSASSQNEEAEEEDYDYDDAEEDESEDDDDESDSENDVEDEFTSPQRRQAMHV